MNKQYKKHKSWGVIGLSRVQFSGPQQLFGSDVTNHTAIQLRLKHASKSRDLGRDWLMGEDLICEILLTPNQFVDMVAHMNVGDGVPCTITWTREDGHIEFEPENNKLSQIEADRVECDERILQNLRDTIDQVRTLIDTNKMPKIVGNETLTKLRSVYTYLDSAGSDFLRAQAKREIESMVVEAKSQVSEFVNTKIFSVGLQTLMSPSTITPQLLEKERDDDEITRTTTADNFKDS